MSEPQPPPDRVAILEGEVLALIGVIKVLIDALRVRGAIQRGDVDQILDTVLATLEVTDDDAVNRSARWAVERLARTLGRRAP